MASVYDTQNGTSTVPLESGIAPSTTDADLALSLEATQLLRSIERAFSQSFTVLDCATGQVLRPATNALPLDHYHRLTSCQQVAERGLPEILDEVSPVLILAVPLPSAIARAGIVAVATFLTERVEAENQIAAAAAEFGVEPVQMWRWAQAQTPGRPARSRK